MLASDMVSGNEEKGVMASNWDFRQEFGVEKIAVSVKL